LRFDRSGQKTPEKVRIIEGDTDKVADGISQKRREGMKKNPDRLIKSMISKCDLKEKGMKEDQGRR